MPTPGDNSPDSPDADSQAFGSRAPADHPPHRLSVPATAREPSDVSRLRRAVQIVGGIAGAVVVAFSFGAIPLPGAQDGTPSTPTTIQVSRAARRTAADQQWALATCTNILDWKNAVHRDATSLNFGFGALARVQDAIAATTRLASEVNRLGLPPGAQTAQGRAGIDQLRSNIESRTRDIQGAASSVANGNLGAIGALLSDLENDAALGTSVVNALRHVVSVDLGLSIVETRACRQLAGIPI
jgi:hypothetical protein